MKILFYKIYNIIYLFFEKFLGLHIIKANYASPLPVTKDLSTKVYNKKYSTDGINLNINNQIKLVDFFYEKYSNEFSPKPNSGLSLVDSFLLYSFVRDTKPKKVVEIGHGDTTKIILNALKKNEDTNKHEFYFVDPFIRKKSLLKEKGLVGIEKKIQDIPVEFFRDVDFLFIDSSHISKIGSDVNYLMLEVIPNLKKNTLIHWHDIYIPYNYPKSIIEYIRRDSMYNESYIVQAFMSYNNKFEILYSGQFLKRNYSKYLVNRFPYYLLNHNLTSFYIRRI